MGIEGIAAEVENPFGTDQNDLPLDLELAELRVEIEYIFNRLVSILLLLLSRRLRDAVKPLRSTFPFDLTVLSPREWTTTTFSRSKDATRRPDETTSIITNGQYGRTQSTNELAAIVLFVYSRALGMMNDSTLLSLPFCVSLGLREEIEIEKSSEPFLATNRTKIYSSPTGPALPGPDLCCDMPGMT